MKKILLIGTFLFTLGTLLNAQSEDKKIGKITFLMVDGKYQDAAFKSKKLIEDPEYRRNAWAYLYLSQSYYEIARKPELEEEFPNALKESLKAAYKLYKYKDKPKENREVYDDSKDFLLKLKDSVITVSEVYYDIGKPRKSAYYLKKITKFDPEDYAVWLMKGVYEIKSRNIGEGVKSIIFAMDSLTADYVPDEVSAQTLVDALDEYALIVKSGEYDKYFSAYKFNPTDADVREALAMKEEFKKYIVGEEVTKEERKKESEVIFKTFRSDDEEEEDDDE